MMTLRTFGPSVTFILRGELATPALHRYGFPIDAIILGGYETRFSLGQAFKKAGRSSRRMSWPAESAAGLDPVFLNSNLRGAGIDRILTMDLHAGQIQGFFQKPCDHMTAMPILTQYFTDLGLEDIVVVSPDAGRVKLNKLFASKMGADLAILNKERPAQQVAEINYVIGDVKGKTALLVDDIIMTAGTLKAAADAVLDAGARQVYVAATHGVFSGDAWENLAAANFEQIVVTDTVKLPGRCPGQRQGALLRRSADQLDPPDLHRRIGQQRVRRREPAVLARRVLCR